MLPKLSRLSLKNKLFLSASLPVFILVLLAIVSTSTLLKQYQLADTNVQAIKASLAIESLINELQKEHGLSTGYLSSNGLQFKQALLLQWQQTDKNIDELAASASLAKTLLNIKKDTELFDSLEAQIHRASSTQRISQQQDNALLN